MTRRRFLLRTGYAIAVAVVLAAAAYVFFLPWIVRRELAAALNAAGLPGVQFDVRGVSPFSLDLIDFQARGAADRIGAVAMRYTPASLWHRRVQGIRLVGVELALAVRDGRFDAGPFGGFKSTGPPAGPGPLDLPFDRIDLESSAVALQLPGRTIRVPAKGTFVRQDDGGFKADLYLTLEGKPLRITGTVGPMRGDVDFAVAGNALDAATVAAVGSAFSAGPPLAAGGTLGVDGRARGSAGRGEASLLLTPVGVSVTVPSKAVGPPTNVGGVGGVFKVEASVAPGSAARGRLTLQGAGFTAAPSSVSCEKIDGVIAFDDFATLTTEPAQALSFGKLTAGKMEFTGGSLVFRLNGRRPADVLRTRWSWLGGVVGADDFHVDPAHPALDATVQATDVDLHRLLAFFAPDKATGEGKVSGRLPVFADGTDVRFGNGSVWASAGGVVRVKDLAAMSATLDQAGQSGGADVKQKVIEALADFGYDVLRADLKNGPQGLAAGVHLAGRGRTGSHARLDVEVNLRGLGDLLRVYLGYQRGMASLGRGH